MKRTHHNKGRAYEGATSDGGSVERGPKSPRFIKSGLHIWSTEDCGGNHEEGEEPSMPKGAISGEGERGERKEVAAPFSYDEPNEEGSAEEDGSYE